MRRDFTAIRFQHAELEAAVQPWVRAGQATSLYAADNPRRD